jgi:hypothetical protein
VLGPILLRLNDAGTVYIPVTQDAFPADFRVEPQSLGNSERLQGPQAETDQNAYRSWHKLDESGGDAQRYLVNDEGKPVYLVDPGINGKHKTRPDGSSVDKFKAPKATLMSYIIKGILDRKLPWGLVMLGVMIAIVLEMSGIPSLAFAVGVYLPLSSSSPIFIGGIIRWLVDLYIRKKFKGKSLTEEELTAEGDKSHGVLMASGYIAGGALAGIVIAFMAGALKSTTDKITNWSMAKNPFFPVTNEFLEKNPGASTHTYADLLSVLPFLVLIVLLYLTGREVILANKKRISSR